MQPAPQAPTLTRAQSLIHDTIARIDAARSKLRANSGGIFPTVAKACDNKLVGARGLCVHRRGRSRSLSDSMPSDRGAASPDQETAGDAVSAACLRARGRCQRWRPAAGHALQEPDALASRRALHAQRRGTGFHRMRITRLDLVRRWRHDGQSDDGARECNFNGISYELEAPGRES